MNNFYLIGLTGNLGSGKSTVRRMLEELGARGIDADLLGHIAIERGSAAWFALVREFGIGILNFNGAIDRRKLGARVFNDPAALARLEELSHPVVRQLILNLLRETDKPIVVVEAIKLIEAGLHEWCDSVWVVTCAPEIAVERVMRDRKISADDARARLNAQGSIDAKLKLAQVAIDNSGDETATRSRVQNAFAAIQPQTARDKSNWLHGPGTSAQPMRPVSPPRSEPAPTIIQKPAPVVPPPVIEKPAPPPPAFIAPEPAAAPMLSEKLAPPPPPPPVVVRPPEISLPQFELRRARRSDLGALGIAFAKRENLNQPLGRAEVLQRFGARGYGIAVEGSRVVAFVGWEVENLVAITRDAWAENAATATKTLPGLWAMVEQEARGLQCEVMLILLDSFSLPFVMEQARVCNFQPQNFQELHQVWRQVAMERIQPNDEVWLKRLRDELITQPF